MTVTTFQELKIPFCFNASDINQRKEVISNQCSLFPGLLAAIAVPGVFPPVKINEKYLVDGGVINNLPVSLIKDTKELIITDITGPIKKMDYKTLITDVLYSSVSLMQLRIGEEEMKKAKTQKIIYLLFLDNSENSSYNE